MAQTHPDHYHGIHPIEAPQGAHQPGIATLVVLQQIATYDEVLLEHKVAANVLRLAGGLPASFRPNAKEVLTGLCASLDDMAQGRDTEHDMQTLLYADIARGRANVGDWADRDAPADDHDREALRLERVFAGNLAAALRLICLRPITSLIEGA